MAEFRPVYMECTKEQFERMRPKLERLGCSLGYYIDGEFDYLTNSLCNKENAVGFTGHIQFNKSNRTEVYTEDGFLKACGYVGQETLQEKEQRLLRELEEVRSQLPKVGDICVINTGVIRSIQTVTNEDIKHFAEVEPLPKELQEQLKPYFNDNEN